MHCSNWGVASTRATCSATRLKRTSSSRCWIATTRAALPARLDRDQGGPRRERRRCHRPRWSRCMEYHIDMGRQAPDLDILESAFLDKDPAAVVDLDPSGHVLRVSTCLDNPDLMLILSASGYPVGRGAITIVPSVCCGGCSG